MPAAPKTMTAKAPVDVPVGDLILHEKNARQGDVDAIAESIKTHGFYGGIIVQKSTNKVIVGNHRLQAARQVGMTTIPVFWADVDDAEAARILLVDNRASDLAVYDETALLELLQDVDAFDGGLTGTGFTNNDIDDLLADLEAKAKTKGNEGLPETVAATHLVFDSPEQQKVWYRFGKWLKKKYPDAETLGERLGIYLPEVMGE